MKSLFEKQFRIYKIQYSIFDAILVWALYYVILQNRPVFIVIVLGISVVIHSGHGLAAMHWEIQRPSIWDAQLNPLVHIDPLGTVILPGLLILSGSGFLIGWAKWFRWIPDILRIIKRHDVGGDGGPTEQYYFSSDCGDHVSNDDCNQS